MPKPKETQKKLGRPPAKSGDIPTDARILQIAARLFMESGFDGVSMGQVADACEVTKAVVYYYFSSKANLFVTAMIQVMEISRQRTLEILQRDEPLYDRLLLIMGTRLQIDATLDLNAIMRGSQAVLTEEQLEEMHLAEQRLSDTLADAFRTAMQSGHLRPVDPMMAARVYLSLLVIGKSELERAEAGVQDVPDVDALAKQLLDMLWVGVRVNEERP